MTNSQFSKWLDIFLSEKSIDLEEGFEVDGPSGPNHMQYIHVINAMKGAPIHEQKALKSMFVKLDFLNQPIKDYLRHLAQAIAI